MVVTSSLSSLSYRLKLLDCYLRRAPVCPGLPPTAIIATTHRCNLSCRMCIRAVRTFDGPNMEFSLFRKIVDEGRNFLRYISMDGPGETIMNPEAFSMIRYAKDRGMRVMFSTNATLLDEPIAAAILDSGIDMIIFSVNGATPEAYEAVHGLPLYEKAVSNIRRFLERKQKSQAPIFVALQMIRLPETLSEVSAFYRQWRKVPGVDFVRVKKDVVFNNEVRPEESGNRSRRHIPCPRLWYGPVFVETNGDVYPCPGVMYKAGPVGNVQEQSMGAIWNNERMQAMRSAQAQGDESAFPECMVCEYPRPRLPLIMAGFVLDPFTVGKLMPIAERLAFWHRVPIFDRTARPSGTRRFRTHG